MPEPREEMPRTPAGGAVDAATGRPTGAVEETKRKPNGRAAEEKDTFDVTTFTGGG